MGADVFRLRAAHPPACGAREPGSQPRRPREGRLLPEERHPQHQGARLRAHFSGLTPSHGPKGAGERGGTGGSGRGGTRCGAGLRAPVWTSRASGRP